jgi:hypothetical protein
MNGGIGAVSNRSCADPAGKVIRGAVFEARLVSSVVSVHPFLFPVCVILLVVGHGHVFRLDRRELELHCAG